MNNKEFQLIFLFFYLKRRCRDRAPKLVLTSEIHLNFFLTEIFALTVFFKTNLPLKLMYYRKFKFALHAIIKPELAEHFVYLA